MSRKFKSIYEFKPQLEVVSSSSEVVRDESLTISQIISLHLRGISPNIHVYNEVQYERGDIHYTDENLNEDYYEMENDFTDFNHLVESSGDNSVHNVQKLSEQATTETQRIDGQSQSMSEIANTSATVNDPNET